MSLDFYVGDKEVDARGFKNWKRKIADKLRTEKVYLGQPVIYLGEHYFTFRSRHGYNETMAFVDLYARVKKY